MNNMVKATTNEVRLLSQISSDTFKDTYSSVNKKSDIDYFILNCCQPAQIESEIKDPFLDYFIFYTNSVPVAYCKLRYHESEKKLEIARFYLLSTQIGKGIAKIFMEHLFSYAKNEGYECLELAVWKENKRAIRFYEKMNFKITGETTFDWGTGKVDDDYLMLFQLENEII